MRYIESDEKQSMRGDKLEEAILGDKAKGLVPFWVSTNVLMYIYCSPQFTVFHKLEIILIYTSAIQRLYLTGVT